MHTSYQMEILFDGHIRRRERMGGRRVVLERKGHRKMVDEREKKKAQMVRRLTNTTNQKAK